MDRHPSNVVKENSARVCQISNVRGKGQFVVHGCMVTPRLHAVTDGEI